MNNPKEPEENDVQDKVKNHIPKINTSDHRSRKPVSRPRKNSR